MKCVTTHTRRSKLASQFLHKKIDVEELYHGVLCFTNPFCLVSCGKPRTSGVMAGTLHKNCMMQYFHLERTPELPLTCLKVRQIRNDFFKPTFLPKYERTNSTLLLVNLFSFVFWKKVKTPKRHFEIN